MKRMFQVIFTLSLISFSNLNFAENSTGTKNEIVGHWILNKTETILSFKNSEMTEGEVNEFSSILSPQELLISETMYSVHKPGKNPIKTTYSVISGSGNDGCFTLQFKDPRIPLDMQQNKFCLRNDRLLLPAPKGAYEVYTRKL